MHLKVFLLFSWLFLSMTYSIEAQTTKEQLAEAATAYQQKNFDKAIQIYEATLDKGYTSKTLHYNLGNSYFRKNQLGLAILNYERALLYAPNNEDILFNLSVANEKQLNNINPIDAFFLTAGWRNWHQLLGATGWSIVGIVMLWLGVAGIILWLMGPSRTLKKQGFLGGITLLLLTILPFALSVSAHYYKTQNSYGIVTESSTSLRSAPDTTNDPILTVHEGLKVQIQDQIGEWWKVKLADGEVGWIPKKTLTKI